MIYRYEKIEFVEFLIQACHGISIKRFDLFQGKTGIISTPSGIIGLDSQRKPSTGNKGYMNSEVESQ